MGRIVITGASSEIGLAIVRRLSALGKPMLLQGHSHMDRLEGFGAELACVDFSDPAATEAFAARLKDVEMLVHAAAVTHTGLLPQLEPDRIDAMIQANIRAVTLLCRAVIPGMCFARKGVIVNISSVTAERVFRGQSVYGATKAYVETFTRGLAAEYAKKGLRCNCVAPGSIESGSLKPLAEQWGDTLKSINASGRFGTAEDVAGAVAFLCSEEARYINGTVLHVDGGHWLGL